MQIISEQSCPLSKITSSDLEVCLSSMTDILASANSAIVFNTGVGGLFSIFPILQRNPDYLAERHKVWLADWYKGIPKSRISTPLQPASLASQQNRDHSTYDIYISNGYLHSMTNESVNQNESYEASGATDMNVRKSKDEFVPSYSKTGWRPHCNSVLLYQAWIAGIDLRTCMYRGSISQKMIRNALTPPEHNCAVFIKAINPSVTDMEVFATFEDPIYSYYKKAPVKGKHPKCAVTITFMDHAAAERYVLKSEAYGIWLGRKPVKVVWSRDPACPAEPFEILQSRVLKLRGPMNDPEFSKWFIIRFLNMHIDFELIWDSEVDNIEPGIREVELHFQSIRGQSRAAKICLERDFRKRGKHHITVEYDRDPCGAIR